MSASHSPTAPSYAAASYPRSRIIDSRYFILSSDLSIRSFMLIPPLDALNKIYAFKLQVANTPIGLFIKIYGIQIET